MAYLGNTPQIGQYRKMDSLTFNGSTQTFNITISGIPFNPPTAYAMFYPYILPTTISIVPVPPG